jgi:hypothetical protein
VIGNGYMRLQKHHLPRKPVSCPMLSCVYNEHGICDDCFINKGNSDATCHKWTNKKVLDLVMERVDK